MEITIPQKCPICYGYKIKMFKRTFINLCLHKQKGITPIGFVLRREKNIISFDTEACAKCEMGALVLAGKDIPNTNCITFIGE